MASPSYGRSNPSYSGALSGIDWSKSNQTSINVRKGGYKPASESGRQSSERSNSSGRPLSDVPVNPYPSVVAPVKSSNKNEDRSNATNFTRNSRKGNSSSQEEPEEVYTYLGFLGSIKVNTEIPSTGIAAIQAPMRDLYYPYRAQKALAQERVLYVTSDGVEMFYLQDSSAEEPISYVISWDSILYVEPLKFSTRKSTKDKKVIRGAFEPYEPQRLTMLGDRDGLYVPLAKEHRQISQLKHPALLCLVVKDPHGYDDYFTHGFVCNTAEEAVSIAKRIRDELEALYLQSLHSDKPQSKMERSLAASTISLASNRYSLQLNDAHAKGSKGSKEKTKKDNKKRKSKGMYTTHTGDDEEDLGSFHLGVSTSDIDERTVETKYTPYDDQSNIFNDNFAIGRPAGVSRQSGNFRISGFSDTSESENYYPQSERPVGVIQPQVSSYRDAFKVLPTNEIGDKTKLKPTYIDTKPKDYHDITPELEGKLRKRNSGEDTFLSPIAPRQVVNPLADQADTNQRTFFDSAPGPLNKMKTPLSFNPPPTLPQSAWHDEVLGNYRIKEKIDNRLESQTIDAKEMPKLESDKKEQEMANLFHQMHIQPSANNGGSLVNDLHDCLGFLP